MVTHAAGAGLSDDRYVAVKINALSKPGHRDAGGKWAFYAASHFAGQNQRKPRRTKLCKGPFGFFFLYYQLCRRGERREMSSSTCAWYSNLWGNRYGCFVTGSTGKPMPVDVLKVMVQMMLQGLDFLHSECHIIHTGENPPPSHPIPSIHLQLGKRLEAEDLLDMKPDNVMVKLEDLSILGRDAKDEYNDPLPQKQLDDRTIHLSRNNYGNLRSPTGLIKLTDPGLAVPGDVPRSGYIQAELYRAPEVIVDAGYSYSADIWSLGVMVSKAKPRSPRMRCEMAARLMVMFLKCFFGSNTSTWASHGTVADLWCLQLWDLLEGGKLFDPVAGSRSESAEYDDSIHIAQITALLGAPPVELLARGKRTPLFYDMFYDTKGVYHLLLP
jgi:serine/threonine-protein kinase SRPK3